MSFFICKILRKFDRLYYFNFATTSSPNSCSASFAGREVGFRLIVTWASPCSENEIIFSRLFYVANGALFENSGTGSACANLGAYFLSQNKYPLERQVHQGDQMGRPNRLTLKLDEQQTIYVGGQVIEVGEEVFKLP